jgi:hypothetical protein
MTIELVLTFRSHFGQLIFGLILGQKFFGLILGHFRPNFGPYFLELCHK